VLLLGGITGPAQAASSSDRLDGWRNARLAAELQQAIVQQNFKNLLDTAPPGSAAAAKRSAVSKADQGYEPTAAQRLQQARTVKAATTAPIHQTPNVDATVIELGSDGHALSAANVLLSPQYPNGRIVPLDSNLSTNQVRWRSWDDTEWDANGGLGTTDVIAGENPNAPIDFMSPYPASVLKLMVGFGVMQLVDKGEIKLDDPYAYVRGGTTGSACGTNVTKPIRQFFDEMITVSKNESTCAMIKLLWDHNAVNNLNQQFVDLGLPYLRLVGTNPQNGGTWGGSNMNALDTAKLLMIINGAAGKLWTAPNGTPVTKSLLSDSARAFFLGELGQNALSQVLSTTVWCGRAYPAPGMPAKIDSRWINPTTGTVTADGRVYGQDVRPCNAAAQVSFAHKTGFVDTSGQDAGIVHNLPAKASRNFIVVVHTNLGTRYIDVNRPADPPGIYPVVYTEKFGLLGKAIDTLVTNHHNG
jgi:hypothetical protein